jgi:hypothetical protein
MVRYRSLMLYCLIESGRNKDTDISISSSEPYERPINVSVEGISNDIYV